MTPKSFQKITKAAKKACRVLRGVLTAKPTIHRIGSPAPLLPSPAPSAPVSAAPAPVGALTPTSPATPLRALTPASPVTPLRAFTPASPVTPLHALTPALPSTPLCALTPTSALTPALAVTPSTPVKASRQKPLFPPATPTCNRVAFTQWATSPALSIGEDDDDLLSTGLGSALPLMPLPLSNSWHQIAGEDWVLTAPRCEGVTLTEVMVAESDVFGLECELEARQRSLGDLKELSMRTTIGDDPDQVYPYDPAFDPDGVEKLNREYYSRLTAVAQGRIRRLEHKLEDADQLLASLFE